MKFVPGPDFPTSGIIKGRQGIVDTYTTGRGRIVMEASTRIEEIRNGRNQIIVTELPYQVNKATLVEKIAQMMRDKKIDGISDIRDESDRHGMRMVMELRRDAQAEVVLNNLFKHTAMRTAFNAIVLALVDGQPQVLGLKPALSLFVQHRQVVIRRRSEFLLKRDKERDHIVQGLLLALDRLDQVIAIIRGSRDVETARTNLMGQLQLTHVQAQAILDMQLRRLAALERRKLEREHQDLLKSIAALEELLASPAKILAEVKTETKQLKKDFGDQRRTIIYDDEVTDLSHEHFITKEDVVITLSQRGYIKRVPVATYRLQHRGGKGVRGMTTREDDALMDLVVIDTLGSLRFFSNRGRVYPLRAFQIAADSSRTTRGTPLINLIPLNEGERIQTMLPVQNLVHDDMLIMATRLGEVKALSSSDLANIRARGLLVMNLEKGDELVSVSQVGNNKDVIMVSEQGQAIRFPVAALTARSRSAGGLRGMRVLNEDRVVSMATMSNTDYLLVVSKGGYGKSTPLSGYPTQGRGGQGVRTFRVTAKTGPVAAARVVPNVEGQEIFIISEKGQVIRMTLQDVRVTGRNTLGVILWRDREPDDQLASIARFHDVNAAPSEEAAPTNGKKPTSRQRSPGRNGGHPSHSEDDS